jgi:kinesin family protein 5
MRPSNFKTDLRQGDAEESKAGDKGNIRVVCRFRPLNEKEFRMGSALCIAFDPDQKTVVTTGAQDSLGPMRFTFDHVFSPDTTQGAVYEQAAKPIVDSVLEGFNGTVFAYGQTASGKTFTMTGPSIDDEDLKGIIPRMVGTVFETIAKSPEHLEFTVKVSYAEIYMEKIRDLLNPEKVNLKIHEDKTRGIYIADLTEEYVSDEVEVYQLMKLGGANREVGSTNMNEGSSRSHSIFSLTITQNNTVDYSARTGKLYLVDLAGSEKVLKTGAEGKRLEEAKGINRSLTMLGLVIYTLTDGKSTHVPYRDSKLTRVLQDSLGGNAKTSLIITCSPHPYNEAETISTMRFGIRAKAIKNKPKVNRELTVAELKLMLAKSERENQRKDQRIAALEQEVIALGGVLPSENELTEAEERKEEGKGAMYDEVLTQLEEQRQRLAEELAKISDLKQELQSETTKNSTLSQENDSLISKLASQTIKFKSLKERLQQLVKLNALKDSLQIELANSNQKRVTLEERLQEAQEEIENLKQDRFSLKRSMTTKLLTEKDELYVEVFKLKTEIDERDAVIRRLTDEQASQPMDRIIGTTSDLIKLEAQLTSEREASARLMKEISDLRAQLDAAVASSLPDLEVIKRHLVEETEKRERDRWTEEKTSLLQNLQSSQDRAVRFEAEMDETREQIRQMEATINERERSHKKKTQFLEQMLEKLTLQYHQLVSQKSKLNVENQVYERKLQRMSDRNNEQIKQLTLASEQLTTCRQRCQILTRELEELKACEGPAVKPFSGNHKIRKRIKGGNKGTHSPGHRLSISVGLMSAFPMHSASIDETSHDFPQ